MTDIQYRFKRKKRSSSAIEDIYDGEVYKNMSVTEGFFNHPYNLWPLFFQINELSFIKRTDPDNMILGGLWFGPKKPTMISYTEPFVKTLKELERNGVQISLNGKTFISKVAVIGGTAEVSSIIQHSLMANIGVANAYNQEKLSKQVNVDIVTYFLLKRAQLPQGEIMTSAVKIVLSVMV